MKIPVTIKIIRWDGDNDRNDVFISKFLLDLYGGSPVAASLNDKMVLESFTFKWCADAESEDTATTDAANAVTNLWWELLVLHTSNAIIKVCNLKGIDSLGRSNGSPSIS